MIGAVVGSELRTRSSPGSTILEAHFPGSLFTKVTDYGLLTSFPAWGQLFACALKQNGESVKPPNSFFRPLGLSVTGLKCVSDFGRTWYVELIATTFHRAFLILI